MTAKSSGNLNVLKNISFAKFGTYFTYKLGKLAVPTALITLMAFLGFPFYAFSMYMVSGARTALDNATQVYSQTPTAEALQALNAADNAARTWDNVYDIAMILLFLSVIGVFIAAFTMMHSCFRYISGKRFVDMDYSLPVPDDTRFFGDLLAGLTAITAPLLAANIVALCFVSATGYESSYAQDSSLFRQMLALIPIFVWLQLLAVIMFYVFSLMVAVCCSRTAESRVVPLVANAAVPIIVGCITLMISGSFFGNTGYIHEGTFSALTVTSPIGLLVGALIRAGMTEIEIKNAEDAAQLSLLGAGELVGVVLITLAFTAAAYALFKIRRSERVGTPYAFKAMKHITPALVTVSVVSVMLTIEFANNYSGGGLIEVTLLDNDSISWLVAVLCVTFVLFIVMEIVSGKAFKRFGITLLRYAATLAGSIAVYYAVILTGNAIAENYVPAASEVESVEAVYSEYRLALDCVITDTDDIGDIIELHRESVKERNSESRKSMSVIYKMKNGKQIPRVYQLSAELSERAAGVLMEKGGMERGYWLSGTYTYNFGNFTSVPEVTSKFESSLDPSVTFKSVSAYHRDEQIPLDIDPAELYRAIILDARDTRYNDYFNNSEKRADIRVNFVYDIENESALKSSFTIPGCFKRTNELLAKCGVSFDIDLSEYSAAVLVRNAEEIKSDYMYGYISSSSAEEYYYKNSVVVPIDSALTAELLEYCTTAPAHAEEDYSIDADWIMYLIYKGEETSCYPLDKLLIEAGVLETKPDDYELAPGVVTSEDEERYDLDNNVFECSLPLRITNEHYDRAAEIFAALKN